MARYASLNDAMVARDDLGEAELRYKLLAETFEAMPQLRANLNPSLDRAKAEIVRLRAAVPKSDGAGKIIAVDPDRFRKSTGA